MTRPEPLRILVAPDKFKGTMGAAEVADAIKDGLILAAGRVTGRLDTVEVDLCPLADGGEGTAMALLGVLGGDPRESVAVDALGREIQAEWALLADGRAVVEVASASGLWRLGQDELDPLTATSRGTGMLIAAAAAAGASEVLVACGGSASTDGGVGAIAEFDPESLALIGLCDTDVAFERAAEVYGPQKGAESADEIAELSERLAGLVSGWPRDPSRLAMTGAAGGLAGGLWAHGAELVPGAAYVLDALDFDARLAWADLVITGEGRLDSTSLTGKAPGEVVRRAAELDVGCVAVVGRDELGSAAARAGFSAVLEAGDPEAIHAAVAGVAEAALGADPTV